MILITGATGFVGKALLKKLSNDGYSCRVAVRNIEAIEVDCEKVFIPDISGDTDWAESLKNVKQVIHSAARVHVMNDDSKNPLKSFRKTNLDGTFQLAQSAAMCGVERFIYISSVKVFGESTEPGKPFTASTPEKPADPYGVSKLEAEQALVELCSKSGMQLVIVRPPLVYGPGVKANFGALVKLVLLGYPLPFGAIENKRSLVFIDNLVDLLIQCLHHPSAPGKVFLVSDDFDVSIRELVEAISTSADVRKRLLPIPVSILKLFGKLVGKSESVSRLTECLQVDISETKKQLNWHPPVSFHFGIQETVNESLSVWKK